MKKIAFTLAEVMITLTVIGVITAVIIPVAIHSKPNESVLKFKKANQTLYQAIQTMVNSDKYYLNGDLGTKPDGSDVDATYFCKTFADIVTVKKTDCRVVDVHSDTTKWEHYAGSYYAIEWDRNKLDAYCNTAQVNNFNEIVTTDNVVFYETISIIHFKAKGTPDSQKPDGSDFHIQDNYLFYDNYNSFNQNRVYKTFCFDIDGLNKGEKPFGYGIRVDGKIIVGPRAEEWLEKSIQGEN